jgi:pimeloyl-ACP methyl ester carboxylesterase
MKGIHPMNEEIHIFRSNKCEEQYYTAYEAMLKKWPVPYEEIYVPTRFGDTHVISSGAIDAPPLVLLHSAGSGAIQWYRNVGPLSQNYRTYSVDVIGEVNKSRTTTRLKTRQDFIDWIVELFDGLNIKRTDMVGNSFGGMVALNTALYVPERVNKIVLISPAATFKQIWAWYWRLAYPYKIGYMINSKRLILSGFNWLWQGFPRDECLTRYTELSKVNGFPSNQLPPPVYTDQELQKIQTPMLLLIGDHEVIYNKDLVIQRATHLVPGLKAEIVPNANHNAQVTAPDWVNWKILEFLQN